MKLSILILAGGGSNRFGEDKAFFEIDGKPMIRHVVERVSRLSEQIVISCSSNRSKMAELFPKAKVIQDKWDKRGALTGILSSLPEIESEYVAFVSCDCPKVNPKVIELLFGEARGHDGAIPRWPNGYLEPLQAVYRTKGLYKVVREAWKNNRMKLTDATEKLPDLTYISTEKLRKADPTLKTFLNVNSLEDIQLV